MRLNLHIQWIEMPPCSDNIFHEKQIQCDHNLLFYPDYCQNKTIKLITCNSRIIYSAKYQENLIKYQGDNSPIHYIHFQLYFLLSFNFILDLNTICNFLITYHLGKCRWRLARTFQFYKFSFIVLCIIVFVIKNFTKGAVPFFDKIYIYTGRTEYHSRLFKNQSSSTRTAQQIIVQCKYKGMTCHASCFASQLVFSSDRGILIYNLPVFFSLAPYMLMYQMNAYSDLFVEFVCRIHFFSNQCAESTHNAQILRMRLQLSQVQGIGVINPFISSFIDPFNQIYFIGELEGFLLHLRRFCAQCVFFTHFYIISSMRGVWSYLKRPVQVANFHQVFRSESISWISQSQVSSGCLS